MSNQTGMLTPEQYREQQSARSGLNRRLQNSRYSYELGADNSATAKSKSMSKMLINVAFILILLAGIIGSFIDVFDMDKFVSFLEVFAYVWAPLVIAVGAGRATKNFVEKKYHSPQGADGHNEGNPPV